MPNDVEFNIWQYKGLLIWRRVWGSVAVRSASHFRYVVARRRFDR